LWSWKKREDGKEISTMAGFVDQCVDWQTLVTEGEEPTKILAENGVEKHHGSKNFVVLSRYLLGMEG
jgi:hypothetical protein